MTEQVSAAGTHRGRLVAVVAIGSLVLVAEVVGGLLSNSLALLADAAHVFTDVAGVSLALLAIWFGSRPATRARTFGYYRLEILAAVANAVVLFALTGWILLEAWDRLRTPPQIEGGTMLAVAAGGMLANLVALFILRPAERESLNLRGAYLEVLGDALGSAAVLIAGAVIALTGFRAADPIASVLIALMILPRTWGLLREAVDVLLEATPKGVDMDQVRKHILEAPGVRDVHDLHAWMITSGMNVVSAHVVVEPQAGAQAVLDHLCRCLSSQFDIEHSTFQLETEDRQTLEATAHP